MRRLALVLALLVAGCFDSNDHGPTAPEVVGALTVTASATSAPADGFSRIEIVAQIDPDADASRRTVQFDTTAGSFVGAAAGASLMVPADISGKAEAFLVSPTVAQTAIVRVSVVGVSSVVKTLDVTFTPADPTALLRISTSTASAPADGATVLQVYADVAAGLPSDRRTVSFTTTVGQFVGGGTSASAVADASNRATADLVAPGTAGTARVTATLEDTTAETTVSFVRALPQRLVVTADQLSLGASLADSTNVTVTLLRDVGTVTPQTVVDYRVLDGSGNDLAFLIGSVTPSDASGRSTAVISPGTTTFRGTAHIRASVAGAASGETTIEIVDP